MEEKKNSCQKKMLPILGGRDLTEVLQSSLFQKYKNLGKSEEEEKMPEKMLSS